VSWAGFGCDQRTEPGKRHAERDDRDAAQPDFVGQRGGTAPAIATPSAMTEMPNERSLSASHTAPHPAITTPPASP
jgi:hypothetical protein